MMLAYPMLSVLPILGTHLSNSLHNFSKCTRHERAATFQNNLQIKGYGYATSHRQPHSPFAGFSRFPIFRLACATVACKLFVCLPTTNTKCRGCSATWAFLYFPRLSTERIGFRNFVLLPLRIKKASTTNHLFPTNRMKCTTLT